MKRDSKSGMVVFDTQKGPLYIEDENGQALLSDVLDLRRKQLEDR